jgi:cytochrome c
MTKQFIILMLFSVVILTLFSPLVAKEQGATDDNLKAMVKEGERVFADTTLGTSGKSCKSCHQDMGRKSLAGKAADYPVYDKKAKRTFTLDQQIQRCIVFGLQGKALPWDSEKITALNAYLGSLK